MPTYDGWRSLCSPSSEVSPGFMQQSRAEHSGVEQPYCSPGEKLFLSCRLPNGAAGNGSESQRNTAPLGGNRARQSQALNRHGNISLLPQPWTERGILALGSPQLLAGRQVPLTGMGARMGIAIGAMLTAHILPRTAAIKAFKGRKSQL